MLEKDEKVSSGEWNDEDPSEKGAQTEGEHSRKMNCDSNERRSSAAA